MVNLQQTEVHNGFLTLFYFKNCMGWLYFICYITFQSEYTNGLRNTLVEDYTDITVDFTLLKTNATF